MKIRNGFVSNSSSSSFVVIGVVDQSICNHMFQEALKKEKIIFSQSADHWKNIKKLESHEHNYGSYIIGGIEYFVTSYDVIECWCAGIDFESMFDTMTGNEIKKKFVEQVKDELDIDIEPTKVKLIAEITGND